MKTARWTGVVVCLVLLAGCEQIKDWIGESDQKKAEKRVKFVFDVVSQSGESNGREFQNATCRWFNDSLLVSDRGNFEWAYDHFREFNRDGGLVKGFQYEIEGSRVADGSAGLEFVVFGTANGRPFEVVVPDRAALRWQVAPRADGF